MSIRVKKSVVKNDQHLNLKYPIYRIHLRGITRESLIKIFTNKSISRLWEFETYSFYCDEFLYQHIFFADIVSWYLDF